MTICQRCAVIHEFIPSGFVGADRVRCDACANYALLAAREECAKIAERWAAHGDPTGRKIADEIRASRRSKDL